MDDEWFVLVFVSAPDTVLRMVRCTYSVCAVPGHTYHACAVNSPYACTKLSIWHTSNGKLQQFEAAEHQESYDYMSHLNTMSKEYKPGVIESESLRRWQGSIQLHQERLPYSGKLSRVKTFANFMDLGSSVKVLFQFNQPRSLSSDDRSANNLLDLSLSQSCSFGSLARKVVLVQKSVYRSKQVMSSEYA